MLIPSTPLYYHETHFLANEYPILEPMFLSYIMSKTKGGETGKGIAGKEWEREWELSGLIAVRLDKRRGGFRPPIPRVNCAVLVNPPLHRSTDASTQEIPPPSKWLPTPV